MPRYFANPDFRHDSAPSIGILLSNLGTPDAPTAKAVRRYLAEFLWDPRVVEIPRPLWWLILHGVILRTRPRQSAEAYEKVWTDAGSPLLVNTLAQRDALRELLPHSRSGQLHIEVGMRYGQPSIRSALEKLARANCDRLLVLPLYPQYSATTTASTFDELSRQLRSQRRVPALQFIDSYHDDPGYIAALATSIRRQTRANSKLLFSFHGIPQRYLMNGDPYHCQCHKTARLVAEQLNLATDDWSVAFQSRLGREEWLRPYTDEVLPEWAESGVKDVDVVCPGFAADCLETLEEVALRYRDLFLESGGRSLHYIPALNDSDEHIQSLVTIINRALATWGYPDLPASQPQRTLELAKGLGAKQ